jgi:hypothetical protein
MLLCSHSREQAIQEIKHERGQQEEYEAHRAHIHYHPLGEIPPFNLPDTGCSEQNTDSVWRRRNATSMEISSPLRKYDVLHKDLNDTIKCLRAEGHNIELGTEDLSADELMALSNREGNTVETGSIFDFLLVISEVGLELYRNYGDTINVDVKNKGLRYLYAVCHYFLTGPNGMAQTFAYAIMRMKEPTCTG